MLWNDLWVEFRTGDDLPDQPGENGGFDHSWPERINHLKPDVNVSNISAGKALKITKKDTSSVINFALKTR